MIEEFAQNLDLTKPLDRSVIEALSLDEIQNLKQLLVNRMVKIRSEIIELEAKDEYTKEMARLGWFNCRAIDRQGNVVFNYTCHWRHADANVFVPGPWVASELEKLEELRKQRQLNIVSFPERKRNALIAEISGAA